MKKIFVLAMLLFCVAVMAAENLLDVADQAESYIRNKYRTGSVTRKAAEDILYGILSSQGKSDEEKIAEIKSKFPEAFQDQPLVYFPEVSYHIHSLGWSYDSTESATGRETYSITTQDRSQSQHDTSRRQQIQSRHQVDAKVSAQTELSLNPLRWLSNLAATKISLSGSYAYGRTSEDLETESWSSSQQESLSNESRRILENITTISNFHLSFSIIMTNNSQYEVSLDLTDFAIPIHVNGQSTNKSAIPTSPTGVVKIPSGNSVEVHFRMDVDNTLVRGLIQDMSQGRPQIRLDLANWKLSAGGESINLTDEPATSKIKFNFPEFSGVWRLRRQHTSDGTPTTLKERLEAIARIFEEKLEKKDLLSWEAETLTAISGVPFGAFSENDRECRYIAFLQIGNQFYDRIKPELLAPSPAEDCTVWIIDINNISNDLHPALKKLIFEKTKIRADQGNPSAQCFLANMYLDGFHVEINPTEAVRYFRMAAEQGNADGQIALGICYEQGIGVEKNPTEAVRYYRMAAEQGNADGQCLLGVCYFLGVGVEENQTEAFRYAKLAAEQGNADGQWLLGTFYMGGIGVEKNQTEAVRYYRMAAEQGDVDAQAALRRLGQ